MKLVKVCGEDILMIITPFSIQTENQVRPFFYLAFPLSSFPLSKAINLYTHRQKIYEMGA